jgi:succinate dehydrogenase / fumarate reductase membrane anchor subunit
MTLRSPIRRVQGLGSAKEGGSHWWAQRVTSVALVVLTVWFVFSILKLGRLEHAAVIAWIAGPVNAVLLVLLLATAVHHSMLGVQVVVEDYVINHGAKIATMLALNFMHVALAALGVFAVLRIAFAGHAA